MKFVAFIFYGIFLFENILSQSDSGYYWIQFRDKDYNNYSISTPEEFLSIRSIQRREKQEIEISESDLPVSSVYLDSISQLNISILYTSSWLNGVVTDVTTDIEISNLDTFTFIDTIIYLKPYLIFYKNAINKFFDYPYYQELNYGYGWEQINMHNGNLLHNEGFTGNDILIAIFDAGYNNADNITALNKLWTENRILGTKDFVNPNNNIFNAHSHGTYVLSAMAANVSGELIGTAPDAEYLLCRTEDAGSEFLIEEYNWLAAAEYADSAGADIINSSLGYTRFDDAFQNHSYEDLDGKTSIISQAAALATSKGMIVVSSAGNEGSSYWKYISCPADADNILSVGAIDYAETIADFSSRGPTADGRIKPDVCAVGVGTITYNPYELLVGVSGTSLSSPIIAGLTACLWESNPTASNIEIIDATKQSADRFDTPDNNYGYGIPNYYIADFILKRKLNDEDEVEYVKVYPIPINSVLQFEIYSNINCYANIKLIDLSGRIVYHTKQMINAGKFIYTIDNLGKISQGIYILQIYTDTIHFKQKIYK